MISYAGFQNQVRKQLEDPEVKSYLNLGLTLITIILLSIFALKPAFLTVYELSLKLTAAKQKSLELKNKIAILSEAQENFNKAAGDIPVIKAAIPSDPNLVLAVDQLNQTATLLGLEVTKIEGGNAPLIATREATTTEASKMTIAVIGSIDQIRDFLTQLEKLPRLVEVQRVVVENKESDYGATVTLFVFYQK